jgi:hypothetical protein
MHCDCLGRDNASVIRNRKGVLKSEVRYVHVSMANHLLGLSMAVRITEVSLIRRPVIREVPLHVHVIVHVHS